MAAALGLLLYLGAIGLLGNVIASFISGNEERPGYERMSLVLMLGTGGLALILFWASLAGFSPSRGLFVLLVVMAGAAKWKFCHAAKYIPRPNERLAADRDWLSIAALTIVVFAVILVTLQALALPVYETDAFAVWGLKAKVLTQESLLSRPGYFVDPNLSFSHLDYPLLVPFLIAGAYGAIGHANEYAGKIAFPILFIALGLQIFSGLRWKLARRASLLLTALAMTLPPLLYWAGAGTADVPLAVYFAGSVFYLAKWMEHERRGDLILSIFYSVCMAFTKNEGFALALLIGAAILFFARNKRQLHGFLIFAGGFALLDAPWLWWSCHLPRIHENYSARLRPSILWQNADRLGLIAQDFMREMLAWSRWSGLWLLLLVAAIAGPHAFGLRFVRALWFILISQLILYVAIFVVAPWDVEQLLAFALERLLIQTTPLVILLIGFHWASFAPAVPRA